ncbi:MAG: hypothetical protein Q7T22_06695 [Serpentinimonas sp.]|nr:hypothetical protein [Serpentinimonas sp.]
MTASRQERPLREIRQHLLDQGSCPPGTLKEGLARSWQRSLAAGLSPLGACGQFDRVGDSQ